MSLTCFHGSWHIFWHAIHDETYISRMDIYLSLLGNLCDSWGTWKNVGTIAFFHFNMREINFLIHLITLPKLLIVFRLVKAVALDAFRALRTAWHSCIFLLLAILTLGDAWVYIGSTNSYNIFFYVKTPIDKIFSLTTTLNIPNVNPNDRYIRFG